MQTFRWLARFLFTTFWGWTSLMSGALMLAPNLFNVYQVANNRPPITGELFWAITQAVGALAFIGIVAKQGFAEHDRAKAAEARVAQVEAQLTDVGAVNRSRNRILARLSDFTGRGNELRESVPGPGNLGQWDSVTSWDREVIKWTVETREFLLTESKSAAMKFDHMANVPLAVSTQIHYLALREFSILERRLENLQDIAANANVFLT